MFLLKGADGQEKFVNLYLSQQDLVTGHLAMCAHDPFPAGVPWWQSWCATNAAAWSCGVGFVSLKAAQGMMQKRTSAAVIVLAPLKHGCFSLTQGRKLRIWEWSVCNIWFFAWETCQVFLQCNSKCLHFRYLLNTYTHTYNTVQQNWFFKNELLCYSNNNDSLKEK